MDPGVAPAVITQRHWERLGELCDILDRAPLTGFDDERAARLLPRTEVLLTHWGAPMLDDAALAAAGRLRMVAHAGGTVRSFLTGAVWDRGIRVTTAAQVNAGPVADYTVAAILQANKDIPLARLTGVKARRFSVFDPQPIRRRVGLVGASRIGRLVIERLAPFAFPVSVHDPYLTADDARRLGVTRTTDLDELCATTQILSIHAPALPTTHGMIDQRRLALLPDGAWLINTARGSLVDTQALVEEAAHGRINAILDVTDPEPLPREHPLRNLPNVFVTPHVAGARGAELHLMTDRAIEEISRFAAHLPALDEVRPEHREYTA